ncbi:MAG: DUF3426 domain-containing protein [Pseudomonadota bacterium]
MALATRCPQCQTAFRVASDQLKLRAGLVRCGTCKEIFNGIENLLHPDEDLPAASADSVSDSAPEKESTNESLWLALAEELPPPPEQVPQIPQIPLADAPAESNLAQSATDAAGVPKLAVPTDLMTPTPQKMPAQPSHDPALSGPPPGLLRAASIDRESDGQADGIPLGTASAASNTAFKRSSKPDLKPAQTAFRKPARKTVPKERTPTVVAPVEPPDFIQREQLSQGKRRITRPLFLTLCGLLTITMMMQLVYATRTSLAAHLPQSRPMLEQACGMLGCKVGLPMQIESVSIESSDLQPASNTAGKFVLDVLLRNRSTTVQAWPAIELSLQDTSDKTIGRRVIVASEFLPTGTPAGSGFAAGSEQAIRINLDLAQSKASGYRVYLFYP